MGDNDRPESKGQSDGKGGGKDRGKGGRRHWRRRKGRYGKKRTLPTCPICESSVRDILTAIAYGEEKAPAHFDCVMKQIGDKENLEPKEKIVYLGGGNFGVVKMRGGGGKFQILRKISVEDEKEIIPEWRLRASERPRKLSRVNLPNLRTSVEINADEEDSLEESEGPEMEEAVTESSAESTETVAEDAPMEDAAVEGAAVAEDHETEQA